MKYFGTPIQKAIGVIEHENNIYFNLEDLVEIFNYDDLEDLESNIPEIYITDIYDDEVNYGYKLVTLEGFYIAAKNSPNEKAKNMINDFIQFISQELDKDIIVDDIDF